jgi:hypothetical protein
MEKPTIEALQDKIKKLQNSKSYYKIELDKQKFMQEELVKSLESATDYGIRMEGKYNQLSSQYDIQVADYQVVLEHLEDYAEDMKSVKNTKTFYKYGFLGMIAINIIGIISWIGTL